MTDPTNPMDDSDRLKPCPFCGSDAEMLTVPEDHPDAGAVFAQCTHSACMASSALVYPLMDDVKPLLLERWNRRTVGAALTPAPAQPEPPTAAGVEPPSLAQLNSACMSYRHDFGLMDAEEQERMRWAAKEWLRAWRKELDAPLIRAAAAGAG